AGMNGIIRVWDATTGKPRKTLRHGTQTVLCTLAFSPDSNTLAAGGIDENHQPGRPSTLILWDVATSKPRQTFVFPGTVQAVVFSADGLWLAAGGDFNSISLRAATGDAIHNLPVPTHDVTSLAFSPDSKTLAAGVTGAAVHLWDVGTGLERLQLGGLERP